MTSLSPTQDASTDTSPAQDAPSDIIPAPTLSRRGFSLALLSGFATLFGGRLPSAQSMTAVPIAAMPRPALAQPARTSLLDFAIAGGPYHGLRAALPRITQGTRLSLRREPENPYDANAVAVMLDDMRLGYIPRRANASIARRLDEGQEVRAEVSGFIGTRHERLDDRQAGRLAFTDMREADPIIRLSTTTSSQAVKEVAMEKTTAE